MVIWKSVVGKLWLTIMGLVALVLIILSMFLLEYIDVHYKNSYEVKKLFVYTAVIGFLLSTFFAFFLSTKITQPLVQMKKAADLISTGEYGMKVPISSTDEIGELAKTLNHMATELDNTIKDLNLEKDNLSSVLKSMTDAVMTFDAKGRVMITNPQGEKLLEKWQDIAWDPPENKNLEVDAAEFQQVPAPMHELFQSVVKGSLEVTSKLNVHSGVWSVVMTPLYWNEAVRGVVAVLRDVTEEYRLDKLRKDFVANVSHELRTPLSMLQGYSEALLDDIAGTPEERKELAQVIHDESLRMGRLVKDLLYLARMEAGHLELNHSRVDVKTLLTRVHRKFSALCKERSIPLELQLSSEELILIDGDEDRLEQVLTNLLDNALRHTANGSAIYLRGKPALFAGNQQAVRIEIADQGQGIPAQDLPYIFERFYKADKARTRGSSSGGTGLGLAIVKNIVEAHHGTVTVESEEGQGTTFFITIPLGSSN